MISTHSAQLEISLCTSFFLPFLNFPQSQIWTHHIHVIVFSCPFYGIFFVWPFTVDFLFRKRVKKREREKNKQFPARDFNLRQSSTRYLWILSASSNQALCVLLLLLWVCVLHHYSAIWTMWRCVQPSFWRFYFFFSVIRPLHFVHMRDESTKWIFVGKN